MKKSKKKEDKPLASAPWLLHALKAFTQLLSSNIISGSHSEEKIWSSLCGLIGLQFESCLVL
jgi:hypothetical protein